MPELLSHVVEIGDVAQAQAVMGPLHRHLALIQESFRTTESGKRGADYTVSLDGEGGAVTIHAKAGAAQDLARAAAIVESLVDLAHRKGKVREGDVHAAIAFSQEEGGGAAALRLPQLGGLTIRTPRQLHYVEAMRDDALDLVFGVGPAGTGKTFLAVAAAVEALKLDRVDRIIVTRPAVEAGERLGYLPGDLAEKVDPYLQPIWDAFRFQMGEADLANRRARRQIEVAPLAFMRGRTLTNAFVIVDEAQNATIPQMRMVLTRLGEGSRMVVTGDPSQTDLERPQLSGLAHALRILEGLLGVEVIRFAAQDVVRHRLVARVIEAYDRDDAARRKGGQDG